MRVVEFKLSRSIYGTNRSLGQINVLGSSLADSAVAVAYIVGHTPRRFQPIPSCPKAKTSGCIISARISADSTNSQRRPAQRTVVFFRSGLFFACGHAYRGRRPDGVGAALSLHNSPAAGGGSAAVYRYRSPHLPPQNPLVGWDNPPAVVALGVDGETSRPRPTAPPQPAALSRHSRAQCPPSQPGRTRPALAGASLAASTGSLGSPGRRCWPGSSPSM